MSETIQTFDYLRALPKIEKDIIAAVRRVLYSGSLILGPETEAFEKEFAEFVGARHCIGVSSGTTAIHLSLMALGMRQGDEVITVANTCAPTVAAIRLTGATPVFVDVREDDLMMNVDLVSESITARTKCILPVHLWGQSVNMELLQGIATQTGVSIVEDCSQAHGTLFHEQHVGTFGQTGCFSFYPTKNLGSFGDAGAVVTNDDDLADSLRQVRMYGYDTTGISIRDGMNARISEIQAAILRVKLPRLLESVRRRREIAASYDAGIHHPSIKLTTRNSDSQHSYHQYVIRCKRRAKVVSLLNANDISYGIHYPVPLHQMPAYRLFATGVQLPVTQLAADEILSLPVHPSLSGGEVDKVLSVVAQLPVA